jgi:hypothetical protein
MHRRQRQLPHPLQRPLLIPRPRLPQLRLPLRLRHPRPRLPQLPLLRPLPPRPPRLLLRPPTRQLGGVAPSLASTSAPISPPKLPTTPPASIPTTNAGPLVTTLPPSPCANASAATKTTVHTATAATPTTTTRQNVTDWTGLGANSLVLVPSTMY